MLGCNININHGLVDDAMGMIRNIEWPALHRDQLEMIEIPEAVFLEFGDSRHWSEDQWLERRIQTTRFRIRFWSHSRLNEFLILVKVYHSRCALYFFPRIRPSSSYWRRRSSAQNLR
ncbi:hypothetical protein EVAR_10904_1 [Eumeta japonica]|uniref:Uncharacterized protein n=1 Tax=Eumeta variegata TaxID=151549 RepID=A0A4C1URK9_EUMVA|nr:hypothetical protein EVAR_10904_1 [Eumeta japonica]